MHPDDGRIVSNFVVQALNGAPLTIYGSGEQTRSFCYVSDLVDGLLRLIGAQDNPRTPINLGNPGEFSMRELADAVLAITGSRAGFVFRPLPTDDPRRRRPDISLARERLGWAPKVSLAEGLPATVDWFRKRLDSRAKEDGDALELMRVPGTPAADLKRKRAGARPIVLGEVAPSAPTSD
jgi:UDP-glucuronate decarboxylase